MALSILSDTFRLLQNRLDCLPKVEEIRLGRYFTTVLLCNGAVGSAMSYYSASDGALAAASARLGDRLRESPNLLEAVEACEPWLGKWFSNPRRPIAAVSTAIVSALSDGWIRRGGDEWFAVSSIPPRWDAGAKSALVVGFGGLLEDLARNPAVCRLRVVDLGYLARREEIETRLLGYRRSFPDREFVASDIAPAGEEFDLVSISGSTLCNETLADFLPYASRGARLILQGQSAAIVPHVLFQAGIGIVMTTLKPRAVMEAARLSFGGDELRRYLEGGLPWIYLTPRHGDLEDGHGSS
jgi:Putative heavy-metal chelation